MKGSIQERLNQRGSGAAVAVGSVGAVVAVGTAGVAGVSGGRCP